MRRFHAACVTFPRMTRTSFALTALLCLVMPTLPLRVDAQTAKAPIPGSIAAHPDWPKASPADVQSVDPPPAPPARRTPRPADVQSVDAILAALYDVISGPASQPRDWNRFRSLFVPDARLIPVRRSKTGNGADVVPYTPEQYQERATPLFAQDGFFERGIHNTTESFGDIAQVFSTYESRHTKAGG